MAVGVAVTPTSRLAPEDAIQWPRTVARLARFRPLGVRCVPSSEPDQSRGRNSLRSLALACAALSAGSAYAASISVESTGLAKPALVIVEGSFDAKDGEQFFTKTSSLSAAIVRLQSNGGSLVAGIQIGETIRLKSFQTLVPAGARCASACAMAWLGGTQRLMGPGAQLGLHSAYNAKSEQSSGVANALLGAYLNRVGLPYSAVVYITQNAPQSVTWLSIADAKRLGIEVSPLDPGPRVPETPASTPARSPPTLPAATPPPWQGP